MSKFKVASEYASDEEDELMEESLMGNMKTAYAMKFKLQTDKFIEGACKIKTPKKKRGETKGRFTFDYPTSVATFRHDRKWRNKANPEAAAVEDRKEKL